MLLFTLVATWNNYFLPLIMLSRSGLYPLTVGLAQQQQTASAGGPSQALFSTVITGSLVAIVPLIIVFLFLQRYWQSGRRPAESMPDTSTLFPRPHPDGPTDSKLFGRPLGEGIVDLLDDLPYRRL